jgi:hypothetical protein
MTASIVAISLIESHLTSCITIFTRLEIDRVVIVVRIVFMLVAVTTRHELLRIISVIVYQLVDYVVLVQEEHGRTKGVEKIERLFLRLPSDLRRVIVNYVFSYK